MPLEIKDKTISSNQEKSIISKDIRLVNTGIRIIPVNVVIFVHWHEYEISATYICFKEFPLCNVYSFLVM